MFSFRWSWKAYDKVYQKEGFNNTKGADPQVPGPGTYSNFPDFGKDAKQATLKGRLKDFSNISTSPGPGTYKDQTSIPKTGRNFYSKYRSINAGSIGPPSNSRFKDVNKWLKEVPGPGEYTPRTTFDKNGQYFLSKFKSSGTAILSSSTKSSLKTSRAETYGPGPGSYLLPSDFGYPKNYNTIKKARNKGVRASSQL